MLHPVRMSPEAGPDLVQAKRALRAAATAVRNQLIDRLSESSLAVAGKVLATVEIPERAIVAAYWPMGSEIDPRPLMDKLAKAGNPICLPVVVGPDTGLIFRRWSPGDPLVPAGFGIKEPEPSAPEMLPDLFLVPMLAFDRRGYRLGYGGGFYDRTLQAARAERQVLAVGIALAEQEMPEVPADAHDQQLDMIVTDRDTIRI